jgi:hypothetical protein
MPYDPHQVPPLFHIDVTSDPATASPELRGTKEDLIIALLRQLVAGQDRHNKLLEELVQVAGHMQRQRATELGQWKQANPELARRCKKATEALARVQNEFLRAITDEVMESEENLLEGDFFLNEFVDRFGPRLAHLNGVVQVLSQLSLAPEPR